MYIHIFFRLLVISLRILNNVWGTIPTWGMLYILYFHFLYLVTRQRAVLISATPQAMPRLFGEKEKTIDGERLSVSMETERLKLGSQVCYY